VTVVTRLEAPLIIGSGVAGLTVALGLSRAYVVTAPEKGSTWWAQGGIAAALSDVDSPEQHATDTVDVAGGLAIREAVDILTTGGPAAIQRLVALGADFDRDESGELQLGREGGHRIRRVVHADGDATGAEVMRTLSAAAQTSETVETIEGRVIDLVVSGGKVAGAVIEAVGGRSVVLAPAVILATGGAGRLYSQTTNPMGVAGSGIAMAARVGARLADLEFVQFHPTALLAGKDPMPLLTEALRGEGAKLVDGHGARFMDQHHPMAELAPRDIVARAIFWQYEKGEVAYLDARNIVDIHERFPTVTAHALSVGLDPVHDLLPVSPAAHYYMGGIDVTTTGQTSIDRLWAVGECSSNGVHGANRLASNSLLEGLVFGARVAADVERSEIELAAGRFMAPSVASDLPLDGGEALVGLRQIMWDRVGLVRTGSGLWEARNSILDLDSELRRTVAGRVAADLSIMIVLAALRRSESRGCHYRADYPESDPVQEHRTLVDPTPAELSWCADG